MKLEVPCSRGCGGLIEVDEQTINNAATLGVDLAVSHDVCPDETPEPAVEAPPLRQFRVQVMFVDVPDGSDGADLVFHEPHLIKRDWAAPVPLIAQIGTTVEARNFAEAVNGPLTNWLNTTWPKLQENAALADLPGA